MVQILWVLDPACHRKWVCTFWGSPSLKMSTCSLNSWDGEPNKILIRRWAEQQPLFSPTAALRQGSGGWLESEEVNSWHDTSVRFWPWQGSVLHREHCPVGHSGWEKDELPLPSIALSGRGQGQECKKGTQYSWLISGLSWQHVTAICFHFLMIQVPRPSRPRSRQRRTVPWGPAFRRDHGFLPKKGWREKWRDVRDTVRISQRFWWYYLILYRCFRSKMGLAKYSACLVVEAVSYALPH